VAIVFVGNHPTCSKGWGECTPKSEGKEGIDRTNITLETAQETMIQQVYAANPKTIVVLISSFPYAITWEKDSIPAIIHMTHCSQETGSALADVLFGDYNPAGRLIQTWPSAVTQLQTMTDYDIRKGRTYMYFAGTPLYPFGYGLSYSTFTYANLTTSAAALCQAPITVSVDVTNTSARPGEEVVQMYLKYPGAAVARPNKQLRGFKRVAIAAGATTTVTMTLPYQDVAYWDSTSSSWVAENGSVQILVGGSSADADLKLSKTITTCSGKVEVYRDNPVNDHRVASWTMNPIIVARHGASIGLALTLGAQAEYDLSLFDLRGFRVGRVTGKTESDGRHFLALGTTRLAAGLYMVSGRISGKEYSNVSMVK
jgi:beta-glucosidase